MPFPLRSTFRLLLVTALCAAVGCADTRAPDDAPDQPAPAAQPEQPDGRPGVPLTALLDGANSRDPATGDLPVLDRLNAPLRVATEPRRNRHDPSQTDTLRTLYYDGLRLTIYEVSGSGKEILQHLEVTGGDYRTTEGLHVGSTRAEVERALGPPDRREDNAFVYEGGGPTPTPLHIRFEGEHVTAMAWSFYVD